MKPVRIACMADDRSVLYAEKLAERFRSLKFDSVVIVLPRRMETARLDQVELVMLDLSIWQEKLPFEGTIQTVLKRADPREVLIGRHEGVQLENFSESFCIGVQDFRQAMFLEKYFQHIRVEPFALSWQENWVAMQSGKIDGYIWSRADVLLRNAQAYIRQKLNPHAFPPKLSLGSFGLFYPTANALVEEIHPLLHHQPSALAWQCEKSFYLTLDSSLRPYAFGLATVIGDTLSFLSGTGGPVKHGLIQKEFEGQAENAVQIGRKAAEWVQNAN